ncbi:hypothetical protein PTKIN_Ptkin06aG0097700 [Pterospermum kingtungense]
MLYFAFQDTYSRNLWLVTSRVHHFLKKKAAVTYNLNDSVTFTSVMASIQIAPILFVILADWIEENALNEKSCVQVMRILLTKAYAEIDELEKDLVLLQSELIWVEHEEWSDIYCNALIAKINCLDISINKLGNKDENDIEVYLLMHEEPAEKLHEIVKDLHKSFFHGKSEQNEHSQDVVVLDSRFGSPEPLATLLKNAK